MSKRLIILLGVIISMVYAQPPIPDPGGRWVIDDANMFSDSAKALVSEMCLAEFDSSSSQVVVYTIDSLGDGILEDYANEVFNAWGIGQKVYDNGVLLLIVKQDHKIRIEVGYGLEAELTDLEAMNIIDNEIRPSFILEDYDQGVINGVENIVNAIHGSYEPPPADVVEAAEDDGHVRETLAQGIWGKYLMGARIITVVIWAALMFLFSRAKFKIGIKLFVFIAVFYAAFFFLILGWKFGLVIVGGNAILLTLFHFVFKPKKYWKMGEGSWVSSRSSSTNSFGNNTFGNDEDSSDYKGGGGGSGGGFSGGGGSSGGGGASGDW